MTNGIYKKTYKGLRYQAKHNGRTLGWYDTLAAAELAIEIANDPHGPSAMAVLLLGFDLVAASTVPTYRLI